MKILNSLSDIVITGAGLSNPAAGLMLEGSKKSYKTIFDIFDTYYDISKKALEDARDEAIEDLKKNW